MPAVMNLGDVESLRTMALGSGGRAHFLAGHLGEARTWLKLALASSGSAYSIWRVSALGSLALVEAWSGNTERAETPGRRGAGDRAISRHARRTPPPRTPTSPSPWRPWRGANRAEPPSPSMKGHVRAEANRRTQLSWVAQLGLALLRAAEGELDQSAAVLTSPHRPAGPPPPIVDERLQALEMQLLRLRGYHEEASRASEQASATRRSFVFEQVAVALSIGQPDRARKLLDFGPSSPEPDNPAAELRLEIQRAWLSSAEGSAETMQAHLLQALELGARHSLVEIFVQAGPAILQLVAGVRGVPNAFREAVLERSRQLGSPSSGDQLVDPLTDRELEILSYLPTRLTNSEMAQRCYVSVNTIKTHMTHIYRKLDVANRNGAIRRAREMGLL